MTRESIGLRESNGEGETVKKISVGEPHHDDGAEISGGDAVLRGIGADIYLM